MKCKTVCQVVFYLTNLIMSFSLYLSFAKEFLAPQVSLRLSSKPHCQISTHQCLVLFTVCVESRNNFLISFTIYSNHLCQQDFVYFS